MKKLILLFSAATLHGGDAPAIDMELQYRYQVFRADVADARDRLTSAQSALRATFEAIAAACGPAHTPNENPQSRKIECVAKPVK